jgi:hypothetical protein
LFGKRVHVTDDVGRVPLAGMSHVPSVEAVDLPQEASLQTPKGSTDSHKGYLSVGTAGPV